MSLYHNSCGHKICKFKIIMVGISSFQSNARFIHQVFVPPFERPTNAKIFNMRLPLHKFSPTDNFLFCERFALCTATYFAILRVVPESPQENRETSGSPADTTFLTGMVLFCVLSTQYLRCVGQKVPNLKSQI